MWPKSGLHWWQQAMMTSASGKAKDGSLVTCDSHWYSTLVHICCMQYAAFNSGRLMSSVNMSCVFCLTWERVAVICKRCLDTARSSSRFSFFIAGSVANCFVFARNSSKLSKYTFASSSAFDAPRTRRSLLVLSPTVPPSPSTFWTTGAASGVPAGRRASRAACLVASSAFLAASSASFAFCVAFSASAFSLSCSANSCLIRACSA
mmetsp:Transcript_9745/g.20240  ORF Transcript_9745/g.20240 Transcript_9745/m.20240 type:complete len:206 (-) Transcript_9745:124-741(-)